MTEHRQGYQLKGEPPDELHPPTGGTGVQKQPTINNEPLSTKQLHELITSQAMTIDRLLGEVGRLRTLVRDVYKTIEYRENVAEALNMLEAEILK